MSDTVTQQQQLDEQKELRGKKLGENLHSILKIDDVLEKEAQYLRKSRNDSYYDTRETWILTDQYKAAASRVHYWMLAAWFGGFGAAFALVAVHPPGPNSAPGWGAVASALVAIAMLCIGRMSVLQSRRNIETLRASLKKERQRNV